jgi:hypothetical protein
MPVCVPTAVLSRYDCCLVTAFASDQCEELLGGLVLHCWKSLREFNAPISWG